MASSSRTTSIRRVLRKSQHGRKPSRPDLDEDADHVTVTIQKDPEVGFGISVAGGEAGANQLPLPIIISQIKPGSPAERAERLKVGMRIVSINGQKIEGCNHSTAVNLIRSSRDDLTLVLIEGLIDWSIAAAPDGANGATSSTLPTRSETAQRIEMPVAFERVQMLYNFMGTREDELTLKKGDIVHVTGRGMDGWCVGTCQRTNATGAFPATYAMRLRPADHIVEAIYAEVEQLGVSTSQTGGLAATPALRRAPPEHLYEPLPEEQGPSDAPTDTAEPLPDYGEQLEPLVVVHEPEPGYSSIDEPGGAAASNSDTGYGSEPGGRHDPLYAPIARDVHEVNGDIYARVDLKRKNETTYAVLRTLQAAETEAEESRERAGSVTGGYATISKATANVVIRASGEAPYARLPEGITSIEQWVEDPDAPPLPERNLDLGTLLPPTVSVAIGVAERSESDAAMYEVLPGESTESASTVVSPYQRVRNESEIPSDLYEDLPQGDGNAPPQLPERNESPQVARRSMVPEEGTGELSTPPFLSREAQRSSRRELREQEKRDKKQRKEDEKRQKQAMKAAKQKEKEEKKRRKSAAAVPGTS